MGDEADTRHHRFAAACKRAEWRARQAWLACFALGGRSDLFEIDAFLEGVATLDPYEQDVLAVAVNERLHDLYLEFRLPYLLTPGPDPATGTTPVQALTELVAQHRQRPDLSEQAGSGELLIRWPRDHHHRDDGSTTTDEVLWPNVAARARDEDDAAG